MSSTEKQIGEFKPYISNETLIPEFTIKSVALGAFFGIVFGAATVYLALKAGLTVSASIPIAVLAISLGRKIFKTTILENNIIQTAGSAGESIAAGVVLLCPDFYFYRQKVVAQVILITGQFSLSQCSEDYLEL